MNHLLSETELEQTGACLADPWLALAAEANQISFFNWDVVEDHLRWNSGAEERLGVEPGMLKSISVMRSFVDAADLARLGLEIRRMRRTRMPHLDFRYRLKSPRGGNRFMEGAAQCLYDQRGTLRRMMGVTFDVTAREHDKLKLAQNVEQMRAIFEIVPDGIIVVAADGAIRSLNRAAESLFGRPESALIGKCVTSVLPWELSDWREHSAVVDQLDSAGQQIGVAQQLSVRRIDGQIVPVEFSVGKFVLGDERLFTFFIRNVSERVEVEHKFEDLRAQYLRGARLTAMGAVAAGLAHELNQPLSAAANYIAAAGINARTLAGSQLVAEQIEAASGQISRTGEIIRRLRGFLSQEEQKPHVIVMHEVIAEALGLALAGRDQNQISVSVAMLPKQLSVFADRVQVQQVLVNLIRNAVEALTTMPGQAKCLEISGTADRSLGRFHLDDNGPGFPDSILAQRHLPFSTTKGAAGMGLGLSICRQIIESQGGNLAIGNRLAGGARVSFTLPRNPAR